MKGRTVRLLKLFAVLAALTSWSRNIETEPGFHAQAGGKLKGPVERFETAAIVIDEDGPVGFEDEQADRLRQHGGQATGVDDLAAGDDQAHSRRTVLSVSDRYGLVALSH